MNGASGEPKGSLLLIRFYHIEEMKTILFITVFAICGTLLADTLSWGSWIRGFACGIVASCWVIEIAGRCRANG